MDKINIKDLIRIKAIELFSEKGFHGTTIREIARAADCSLPMLYYYYKNKNDLFEEIVYKEFIKLIDKLNNSIDTSLPLQDIYFQAIKQRKDLNSYDKSVYKLANKVSLGFEGNTAIQEKLNEWEKSRYERNKKILSKICSEPEKLETLTEVLLAYFSHVTLRIILHSHDYPDEKIKNEINYIFSRI